MILFFRFAHQAEAERLLEQQRLERIEYRALLHPPIDRPTTRRDTFIFVQTPTAEWMRESVVVKRRRRRRKEKAKAAAGGGATPGTAATATSSRPPVSAKSKISKQPGTARSKVSVLCCVCLFIYFITEFFIMLMVLLNDSYPEIVFVFPSIILLNT